MHLEVLFLLEVLGNLVTLEDLTLLGILVVPVHLVVLFGQLHQLDPENLVVLVYLVVLEILGVLVHLVVQ